MLNRGSVKANVHIGSTQHRVLQQIILADRGNVGFGLFRLRSIFQPEAVLQSIGVEAAVRTKGWLTGFLPDVLAPGGSRQTNALSL